MAAADCRLLAAYCLLLTADFIRNDTLLAHNSLPVYYLPTRVGSAVSGRTYLLLTYILLTTRCLLLNHILLPTRCSPVLVGSVRLEQRGNRLLELGGRQVHRRQESKKDVISVRCGIPFVASSE